MMNNYLVFAIISALAIGSILSMGGLLNTSVMAQENMTMTMDNSSMPMDNMTMTMDNSTNMSNNTTTP